LWRSKDPSRSRVTTVRETTLRRLSICTGEGLMFELEQLEKDGEIRELKSTFLDSTRDGIYAVTLAVSNEWNISNH
jgi:hypothetical protein